MRIAGGEAAFSGERGPRPLGKSAEREKGEAAFSGERGPRPLGKSAEREKGEAAFSGERGLRPLGSNAEWARSVSDGIRTRVTCVKGGCPRPG
jgi:hypothetical protein